MTRCSAIRAGPTTRTSGRTPPHSGSISTDARWSQAAFKEKLGSSIRQLSDFEPKGATARAFGVLHEGGFTQRALVIVDPEGIVTWSYQTPSPGEFPGANLIFDGLAT